MTSQASALLVRTMDQEIMASDFCPAIYCTGYRDKATELDLFPLRILIAKPFANTPLGGSAAGSTLLQSREMELMPLGHGTLLAANPKHKQAWTETA